MSFTAGFEMALPATSQARCTVGVNSLVTVLSSPTDADPRKSVTNSTQTRSTEMSTDGVVAASRSKDH